MSFIVVLLLILVCCCLDGIYKFGREIVFDMDLVCVFFFEYGKGFLFVILLGRLKLNLLF